MGTERDGGDDAKLDGEHDEQRHDRGAHDALREVRVKRDPEQTVMRRARSTVDRMLLVANGRVHWKTRSGPLLCQPNRLAPATAGEVEGTPACAACALVLLQLDLAFGPKVATPRERPSMGLAALQRTPWPGVIRLERIEGPDWWSWDDPDPDPDPPAAAAAAG